MVKEVDAAGSGAPPEYAKGLEGLLLKEQENDQMSVQAEIKQKEVRVAEYEAEADKVREEEGRGRCESARAGGQGGGRRHAVDAAAEGEAD